MTKNIQKLQNLQKALFDCGINTELKMSEEIIALTGTLWNCVNGNEEPFCFYIDELEFNSISSYIDPETDNEILMEELESWSKE